MKRLFLLVLLLAGVSLSGCGYTTGSVISSRYQTIFVEPFDNKIEYMNQDERKIYIPQLETKVREAVIDRMMFDGNLKIGEESDSDLVLKGQVLSFERGELRMTDNSDVKEYRLTLTVSLTLWDSAEKKNVWEEPSFSGSATYYTTGPLAKSEAAAIQDLLTNLARRVVARTVEDW
ncbi:MAG: LptE family protein [Candidatus Omnitrophica bacterium]|nr:LptE family protein [Candidatus Omnitrophota bacterium]